MLHLLVTIKPPASPGGLSGLVPEALGVPAEWRIAGVILLGAFAVTRPLPFLIRVLCRLVDVLANLMVTVCLFAEYIHIRRRLDDGASPPSLVVRIDSWLELGLTAVHAMSRETARLLGQPRKLGLWWWMVLTLALVPQVLALVATVPRPPSSIVALSSTTAAVWRPVDGWIMTGRLRPAAPSADCSVSSGTGRPSAGGP